MPNQDRPPQDEADTRPGAPPGMPRWVRIAALVVGVLILLFVLLQLTGVGGDHGPGRHMSGQGPVSPGASTSASEGQPAQVGLPA